MRGKVGVRIVLRAFIVFPGVGMVLGLWLLRGEKDCCKSFEVRTMVGIRESCSRHNLKVQYRPLTLSSRHGGRMGVLIIRFRSKPSHVQ